MELTARILTRMIPITQFNKGQASHIFDRLKTESELIVLKNNQPSAVILSPEEFMRLSEIEENYELLLEATKRLALHEGKDLLSDSEVMTILGLSKEEIEKAEDLEIE